MTAYPLVAKNLLGDEAAKAVKSGDDVLSPTDDAGRHLATKLGGGARPIKEIHGQQKAGYRWHYHVSGRPGGYGHIFVSTVVGLLISLVPGAEAEAVEVSDANPILEQRAKMLFQRSYYELNAEERRGVFESFKVIPPGQPHAREVTDDPKGDKKNGH